MNIKDIDWLLHTFPNYRGRTIRGEVLAAYYKAEMILSGKTQIRKRGCSCELGGMARAVDNSYNKWLQNEKTLPNGE